MDIMIDIETLGTRPTSAILSIGACSFNGERVIDKFYENVMAESCTKRGLTVDGSTFVWWLEQSQEAVDVLSDPAPIDIAEALAKLTAFIVANRGLGKQNIWSNSPTFDLAILRNAYAVCGMDVPWPYYRECDCRTLFYLARACSISAKQIKNTDKHNALSDAVVQAENTILVHKALYGKGQE